MKQLLIALVASLYASVAVAQVQPAVANGTIQGNMTGSIGIPSALPSPIFYVIPPVTTASITKQEQAACSAGGGTVAIPPGTYTAASGAITGPLPVCTTASVAYDGTGFGLTTNSNGYGVVFIGNGTFDGLDYNNVDCGGGTCTEPTNPSTFIAGMLPGVVIRGITFDGFIYGVKCGALYEPGCANIRMYDVQAINNSQWGFWLENFWKESRFENIFAFNNVVGQAAFCSSGGSANQNGNSTVHNIYTSSDGSNFTSRSLYVCARGTGGSLNEMVFDGFTLAFQEGHTFNTQSVTWQGPATVSITASNTSILLNPNSLAYGDQVVFSSTVGNIVAGTVYWVVQRFSSNFEIAATEDGTAITPNTSCTVSCPTVTSYSINVSNASKFIADEPLIFTGTLTNVPVKSGSPVFVLSSYTDQSGVSQLITVGGTPGTETPIVPTGLVDPTLGVEVYGFSPVEVIAYNYGTSHSSVLNTTFAALDAESGTCGECGVPASYTLSYANDVIISPSGYIWPGSIATGIMVESNNPTIGSISGGASSYYADSTYSMPTITGSRSQVISGGGNNIVGVGLSKLNNDFASNVPRCYGGTGLLFISGIASYDACYNSQEPFISWDNFPFGAATTPITGTTTILPGATTSNVLYTGTGTATITLPGVGANSDGAMRFFTNPSASTLTLAAQFGQLFNNSLSTLSIRPYSSAIVWSQADSGTYGYSAVSGVTLAGTTGTISGSVANGSCDTGTAAITGVTSSMVVVASPVSTGGPGTGWSVAAYMSGSNTATVQVCNGTGTTGSPTASVYNVRAIP